MTMKWVLSVGLALAAPAAGLQARKNLRLTQTNLDVARSALGFETASSEHSALLAAEAEDRRFWLSQWDALESELSQLKTLVANATSNTTVHGGANASANATPMSAIAAASRNIVKSNVSHVAAVSRHVAKSKKVGNSTSAVAPSSNSSAASVVVATSNASKSHSPHLKPASRTELVATLAMLKGLFENDKKAIADLNAREQESKKDFEVKRTHHLAKLASIEACGKNHSLSAEFVANETRAENQTFKYWAGVRDRAHHSFHTSLNIQHSMMARVKSLIAAYEKALAGQQKSAFQKDLMTAMGGSLAMLQQAAASFCSEALQQVQAERTLLRQGLFGRQPPASSSS